ncbi:hypothetical protein, partial [Thermus scotoductus]|uniref:hypothetical protein n=1 Tax=Thermus scotoductus TaxID=37636 RepID=UPI003F510062
MGTALFKAFGLAVATTGLSQEAALQGGFPGQESLHSKPGRGPLLPGLSLIPIPRFRRIGRFLTTISQNTIIHKQINS